VASLALLFSHIRGHALADHNAALRLDPKYAEAFSSRGITYQSMGDLDRAISAYETLIRAAPDNPQFVFEECEALLQRGDRTRALKLVSDLEARAGTTDTARAIDQWAERHQAGVERLLQTLAEIRASRLYDTTTLAVALRELRALIGAQSGFARD